MWHTEQRVQTVLQDIMTAIDRMYKIYTHFIFKVKLSYAYGESFVT